MPLSDFVRYLNAQHPASFSGENLTSPFISEDGKVTAHYAGLRLETVFLDVINAATGELQGHAANLVVSRIETNLPLQADVLYAQPRNDVEFIYLDRLVRTLHTLNYLTRWGRNSDETLLLGVHPRHVASVSADHGLAFEEILQRCGLFPEQITLEFDIRGKSDSGHLIQAFSNYKSRGYDIAVSSFADDDLPLLKVIQPEIVKLEPQRLSVADGLKEWVTSLHELGARVMIEGLNAPLLKDLARETGIDLLQIHEPLRRLIHAQFKSEESFSSAKQQLAVTA